MANDMSRREWFAITAFPLFAGTFGTIASALNICALVQPWRCVLVNEHSLLDLHDIPDPPWYIPLNSSTSPLIAPIFLTSKQAHSKQRHLPHLRAISKHNYPLHPPFHRLSPIPATPPLPCLHNHNMRFHRLPHPPPCSRHFLLLRINNPSIPHSQPRIHIRLLLRH